MSFELSIYEKLHTLNELHVYIEVRIAKIEFIITRSRSPTKCVCMRFISSHPISTSPYLLDSRLTDAKLELIRKAILFSKCF